MSLHSCVCALRISYPWGAIVFSMAAKYKGENIVTSAAKRLLKSPYNVLDLWVTSDLSRCFYVLRNWQEIRQPVEQTDAIYCGQIYDRYVTQGEIEYQIWQHVDRLQRPWQYLPCKVFVYDEATGHEIEIPKDISSVRWRKFTGWVSLERRIEIITNILTAENKARKAFDKYYPERREWRVEVDGYKLIVRGHGRYNYIAG